MSTNWTVHLCGDLWKENRPKREEKERRFAFWRSIVVAVFFFLLYHYYHYFLGGPKQTAAGSDLLTTSSMRKAVLLWELVLPVLQSHHAFSGGRRPADPGPLGPRRGLCSHRGRCGLSRHHNWNCSAAKSDWDMPGGGRRGRLWVQTHGKLDDLYNHQRSHWADRNKHTTDTIHRQRKLGVVDNMNQRHFRFFPRLLFLIIHHVLHLRH